MKAGSRPWRISADTGGTFTDVYALAPDGSEHHTQLLSSATLRARVASVERGAIVIDRSLAAPDGVFETMWQTSRLRLRLCWVLGRRLSHTIRNSSRGRWWIWQNLAPAALYAVGQARAFASSDPSHSFQQRINPLAKSWGRAATQSAMISGAKNAPVSISLAGHVNGPRCSAT